jgi:copper chaperone NosL
MKQASTMVCLGLASLVGGCGSRETSRPPNVRYGQEACAFCRMIISDDRFAAAVVTDAGEALKFDDLGCLVEHEMRQVHRGAFYWVRDFGGARWLDAREATFVYSNQITSPMNHGLAAFPDAAAAGGLVTDPASRKLRFSELSGFLGNKGRETASALGTARR